MKLRTILIEDKANQDKKHIKKHSYWESIGVDFWRYPLPAGDYIVANEKVLDVISRKQKRDTDVKKLDFIGTYSVSVDTKKDMQEIIGNICGRQHERFRDECILAQNNGIKLYILIENKDGVKTLEDVQKWQNPRLIKHEKIKKKHAEGKWKSIKLPRKAPTSGETLAKAMATMQEKYGVEFLFCTPDEAGARVLELLKGEVQ